MTKNIGSIDRIIRFALGSTMIALGAYFQNPWGLVGLIPLATSFVSSCPLYLPFKFSTMRRNRHDVD